MTEQVAPVVEEGKEVQKRTPSPFKQPKAADKAQALSAEKKVIEAAKEKSAIKEPIVKETPAKEEKPAAAAEAPKETPEQLEKENSLSKSVMAELGYEDEVEANADPKNNEKKLEATTTDVTKTKEYQELEAKYKELAEMASDEDVKEFYDFKKKGVKVSELRKAVTTQTLDVDKLTNEQVHDEYLKTLGLSPEDLAIEKEAFAKLLPSERISKLKAYKNELKEANKEGVVPERFKEVFANAEKRESEYARANKESHDNTVKALGNGIDELVGKEYKFSKNTSFVIPEADKNELMSLAYKYTPYTIEKGVMKYDHAAGIQNAIRIKYFDTAVKEAAKAATQLAVRKFYRPDSESGITPAATGASKAASKEEVIRKLVKRA